MSTADLIVANACVLTMDAARPTAQAVAVWNGRILVAGSEAEIATLRGPDTTVLDAAGHTVLPGIHDAHFHVSMGAQGIEDAQLGDVTQPGRLADAPTSRGIALFDPEPFERIVTEADRLGLQVAVDAIGDAAVRRALDAYEAAARVNGARDARHRVEHIELIDPADVPRFRELGVVASMQPLHASCPELGRYTGWLDKVGAERWLHAFTVMGGDVVFDAAAARSG